MEDAYGKALEEAFNSKTPAEHLADSKYFGRGPGLQEARRLFFQANPRLHATLSTSQLSVPQIVDALRENSVVVAQPVRLVTVLFQLVVDDRGRLKGLQIRHHINSEASTRLLDRVIKKGSIRSVVVHRVQVL